MGCGGEAAFACSLHVRARGRVRAPIGWPLASARDSETDPSAARAIVATSLAAACSPSSGPSSRSMSSALGQSPVA